MIIGTGNDLVAIARIERAFARFGDRFKNRCFTETESAVAEGREESGRRLAAYAKRFAAKEACAKALGTGFSNGVFMRDIGVVNDAAGRPSLCLTGGARARLLALTPPGKTTVLHLTMTDEPPMAAANVMIEAV